MHTFDEEPTQYVQTKMTDRFDHRTQGWCTVADVDVRVKKVKLTYVKDRVPDGPEVSTYFDMDLDCPIVRQEETDEHILWRLEKEIAERLDERISDTGLENARVALRTKMREATSGKASISRSIERLLDLVTLEEEVKIREEVKALYDRGPDRWRSSEKGSFVKGDAATVIVFYIERERKGLLNEMAGASSRGSTSVHVDLVDTAQANARARHLARSYSDLGSICSMTSASIALSAARCQLAAMIPHLRR